jgi:hypothetical protein|tara:strand:- start:8814 stop:9011 length:198 start_codon:yes stop_codon:yes gene_type:complete
MNSKKAKLLRKSLKEGGVDWRDSQPVQREKTLPDGTTERHPTIFQNPKGGRFAYRALKKTVGNKK